MDKILTYSYDPAGNRTLLIDSDDGLTTYSYDAQDRIIGIVNPYSEITTVQYDALDRESERTLANGMTVNHTYDSAGRETVLSASGPSGVALSWYTATYDAVGNRTGVVELDGSEVAYDTTYAYDPVGNLLAENAGGGLTTYSWDYENRLIGVSSPSGVETYSYSADGMREEKVNSSGTVYYVGDGENVLIDTDSNLVTQVH